MSFIQACGGEDSPQIEVTLGDDFSANEGSVLTLSASIENASDDVEFRWQQMSGPEAYVTEEYSSLTELFIPHVSEDTDLVMQLICVDGRQEVADEIVISVVNLQNGPYGSSSHGIEDDAREDRRAGEFEDRRFPSADDLREVRTYDGSHNNLENPGWGAVFSKLERFAASDYTDGISSLAGILRPSARVISNEVSDQIDGEFIANTFGKTDMVWQWGQFIDHDLDLSDGVEEEANIDVPLGDMHFDPFDTGLIEINFARAIFDEATGTSSANPREQENEITAWLDGSMIYGSDEERHLRLRVGEDSPFLKTSEGNLLPFNVDVIANANGFVSVPESLFLAGDVRANEQVGLAAMHTLWVREHNRLAQQLMDDGFHDDPEVLFQQARRMVVAKLQKITYDEFLPALLGSDGVASYNGYDESRLPGIYNEFSAAAYRFGHTLVNQTLLRLDVAGNEIAEGHLSLRGAFFTTPQILTGEDSLNSILRGLATQPHQALDTKVVTDLRNMLFGAPGDGGLDLVSLNIQRGRDHGLPSYNDVREALGLARKTEFSEITADIEMQQQLLNAYNGDINQIDLWIGGLSEDEVGDSQFGELFHLIIKRQFEDLRDADRFWYEIALTDEELQTLENASLSQVIRDNTGVGEELGNDVFSVPLSIK